MLFCLGALATFIVGGLTGVMIAVAPFDFQVHDTYFIVAHLHYTLIGGMLFPVMAGVWYFYPFVTGKRLSRNLGIWSFWLAFTGFNVTFLPMHLTGLLGMPRRVFTYGAEMGWDWLNLTSTIGAFIFAAGFLVFVWDCVRPKGKAREHDAQSVEGRHARVARAASGAELRHARDPLGPQPLSALGRQGDGRHGSSAGDGLLNDAQEGRRETLVTTVLDAEPLQVLRVQGPTWVTDGGRGRAGRRLHLRHLQVVVADPCRRHRVLRRADLLALDRHGRNPREADQGHRRRKRLPLYRAGVTSTGWWAMFITMTGDLTAYLSLVFGYFFFWTVHEDFPPPGVEGPGWVWPLAAAILTIAAWGLTLMARLANARESVVLARVLLVLGVLAGLGSAAALLAGPWTTGLDPTSHSYPAIVWALAIWIALHLAVGVIMQAYCLARSWFGTHDAEVRRRPLERHALLALHRVLRVGHRSRDRRLSAGLMSNQLGNEVVRETGSGTDLWRVIAAPIVWALHFLFCYIYGADLLREGRP